MILLTYWKSNNLEDGENWKDKKEHIYKSLFGRLYLKWSLNPNWQELRKQEKCSSRSKFYKTQWAWQRGKLTWLMSIFTSKKVWKFLIKIQSQNYKGGKSALSHAK